MLNSTSHKLKAYLEKIAEIGSMSRTHILNISILVDTKFSSLFHLVKPYKQAQWQGQGCTCYNSSIKNSPSIVSATENVPKPILKNS